MTTIPHEPTSDVPGATGPAAFDGDAHLPPARGTGRSLLAAALVFVGGYLLLTSLLGQLPASLAGLAGPGPLYTALLVGQLLFAIVVVLVGLFAARGSMIGKLLGALVVVIGTIVTVAVVSLRISGALRLGIEASFTIANAWLMMVLLVGVAWLLVRRARLGWLALLGVVVLSPTPYWLFLAGVESGLVPLVMYFLTALVGAGILAAGRPWRD